MDENHKLYIGINKKMRDLWKTMFRVKREAKRKELSNFELQKDLSVLLFAFSFL